MSGTMLHLMKLAVGARDIAHIRAFQSERTERDPPLRHRTRHFPRRAEEIIAGGSIYWVVCGAMIVRQRVLDVVDERWEDGSACAALLLDPALVPVEGRLMKPFQGWRYLEPKDAPLDVAAGDGLSAAALPAALRRELRTLCLL